MLHFSAASRTRLARRDGRREHAEPLRGAIPARTSGEFLLSINGQVFALELHPDRRHKDRWFAFRNGEPFEHGGLERIWRKVQSELVPLLSIRRID